MEMPETRYARSGEVNIAYQVFGDGEVPLVWAPGFAQHLELSWEEPNRRAWFEGLGRFARVIVFDKRGTGLRPSGGVAATRGAHGRHQQDSVGLTARYVAERIATARLVEVPGRGAIRCACAVSESVGELGIEIRAGLHTGECEVVEGKVGGIAVHIGARVAAEAEGGEVLVSGTVKDLVAGSGLQFRDRGAAELKGVPGEWQLYAVQRQGAKE
jgi:class 3 adenylate cyclase